MKNRLPARREELLDQIVNYLLHQGLAEASLRPLGAAVGTNARMLMYHFNSKEELLVAALSEARRRHLEVLEMWAASDKGPSKDMLSRFWSLVSSRRVEPYIRLSLEAEVLAAQGQRGLRTLATAMLEDWVRVIEEKLESSGLSAARRRPIATAAAGAFRGLLLDLAVTAERARVNAAAHVIAVSLV